MKRCPTCQEEFADKFGFCPVDGTPLSNGFNAATAGSVIASHASQESGVAYTPANEATDGETTWSAGTTRAAFDIHNNLHFTALAVEAIDQQQPHLIYQRYARFSWAGVVASLRVKRPLFLEYNGSETWIAKTIGIDIQRFFQMRSRAFGFAGLQQCETEIVLRVGIVRPNAQCFFRMLNRFVNTAAPHQKISQARVREEIIFRHCDRVRPERFAIAPVRCLDSRGECERDNNSKTENAQRPTPNAQS